MQVVAKHQPTAISFDSATFRDAQGFCPDLDRIDPLQFLSSPVDINRSYINLVTRDLSLRQQIATALLSADKCSLIALARLPPRVSIGQGCLIYPNVTLYSGCRIASDVIIHSNTLVAHDCEIEDHCFISGGVLIGGSTKLGSRCQLMLGSTIFDNLTICDDVTIGAGSIVHHDITEPGIYANLIGRMKRVS